MPGPEALIQQTPYSALATTETQFAAAYNYVGQNACRIIIDFLSCVVAQCVDWLLLATLFCTQWTVGSCWRKHNSRAA